LFALLALLAAVPSVWASTRWGISWIIAAVLFALTAAFTLLLALRPVIEVHEAHIQIGTRMIYWGEIRGLDRVSVMSGQPWSSPLLLRMTLTGGQQLMIFHPGDVDSCLSLLRHLYRHSRSALLDGIPYNEFWGEPAARAQPPAPLASLPRPRLLLAEDEEEVERMFRRLKAGRRLDDSAAGAGLGLDQHGSDES
jgi:hypothetical protein